MQLYGKYYDLSVLSEIKEIIQTTPEISRTALSRQLCLSQGWYSMNGKPQEMSVRKGLAELNRQGQINLPEVEKIYSFQKKTSKIVVPEIAKLNCNLIEIGEIIIEPISSRYTKDSKAWFYLMENYHYLGGSKLCGEQIRYIVKSPERGYIGAVSFSSATWKIKARDKYIGWSDKARSENIKRVINNGRFLIVPTVEVRNLGSYIFSRIFRRLPDDWEERYKVRPVLVESYVDPERFKGTVYKASNWEKIGTTSGRRDGVAKEMYLYKLNRKWKEELCKEKEKQLGDRPVIESNKWVEKEFGRVSFYDNRLKNRLFKVADGFYNKPQANIPEACGSKAGTIAAYRFFQNKKVKMEVILDSHTEATIERIREQKVVLAPQDTTILDYSTHPMTEGLGPTNNQGNKSIGLILHDTVAFTEEGTPLGVIDAQCWAREDGIRQRYKRKELPIEQKESIKWLRSFRKVREIQKLCPDTMLISIGDRESDIYELLKEAVSQGIQPKLIVRATRVRKRKTEDEYLWDYMLKKEAEGGIEIQVPRKGKQRSRIASATIRYADVEIQPPNRLPGSKPINIRVVYLLEDERTAIDNKPIEWMLLTTMEVNNFEDAARIVKLYTKRWGIEIYHKTLKSGCRIEDRQLGSADSLEAALGIDMVVAWRIFHMTMLGREVPDSPCTVFFKEEEWKALHCYTYRTPKTPNAPPSLKTAIEMLGRMGGHLGRKADGMPGTETLWRGLEHLVTATEMYVILTKPPPE